MAGGYPPYLILIIQEVLKNLSIGTPLGDMKKTFKKFIGDFSFNLFHLFFVININVCYFRDSSTPIVANYIRNSLCVE